MKKNRTINPAIKKLVEKSHAIADQLHQHLLELKISPLALAKAMNVELKEVENWLAGTHNLDLKMLCKIEAFLGKELIIIPKFAADYLTVEFLERKLEELKKEPKKYRIPEIETEFVADSAKK